MSNINDKLSTLQQSYANNIPEKIREIENLWNELREQWASEKLSELYRKINSLHNSAGIFGFNELGDTAGVLEKYISTLPNKSLVAYDEKRKIQESIQKLKSTAMHSPTVKA